jgi:hypothetical protein
MYLHIWGLGAQAPLTRNKTRGDCGKYCFHIFQLFVPRCRGQVHKKNLESIRSLTEPKFWPDIQTKSRDGSSTYRHKTRKCGIFSAEHKYCRKRKGETECYKKTGVGVAWKRGYTMWQSLSDEWLRNWTGLLGLLRPAATATGSSLKTESKRSIRKAEQESETSCALLISRSWRF